MLHVLAPAALLALAPALPSTAPRCEEIPFEELARRLAAPASSPEEVDLAALLDAGFARLPLGALDLRLPVGMLAERDSAEELRDCVLALAEGQAAWVDLLAPKGSLEGEAAEVAERAREDARAVARWVKGWKPKALAGAAPGADLAAHEDLADEEERAALARLAAALTDGGALPPARPATLVLAPDRETFVGLAAVAGWLHPDLRGIYWDPAVATWVEMRVDDLRVVALRFAAPGDDWRTGVGMSERNPEGLEQQVGQLAHGSVAVARFGDRLGAALASALASDLVIDQHGAVDTRSDGDLRSRETSGREVFVRGGMSHGGLLPPNRADSPWRETLGADRFVDVLRRSQKAGAKELGDRRALDAFLLTSDDGRTHHVVRAPLLGPGAETTDPPTSFHGDWLEFRRAYLVAFVHWLRTEAGGKKDAPKRFAALLRGLSSEDGDLARAAEEAYGVAWTTQAPGEGDLEGRFLAWLGGR